MATTGPVRSQGSLAAPPTRVAGGLLPLGRWRLGWAIWAELALTVALLALIWQPRSRFLVAVVVFVAIVLAIPLQGRSLLGWLRTGAAFLLRRRHGPGTGLTAGDDRRASGPGPRIASTSGADGAPNEPTHPDEDTGHTTAMLAALVPGLSVATTRSHDAAAVGVVGLDGKWAVVLTVRSDQQIVARVGEADTLPLNALVPLLSAAGIVLDAIQVVVINSPGSAALPERSAALTSHLELLGGLPTAARRRVFVALRLNPADCPLATIARGGGVDGAHRALVATAARAISVLTEAGFQMRTMDAAETAEAITAVAGLPRTQPATGSVWAENWADLELGALLHRSSVVTGWGQQRTDGQINPLDQLANIRARAVTTSVTITGDAQRPQLTATVRVTADRAAELVEAERQLLHTAGLVALRVVPTNGHQYRAFVAGLPLGGPTTRPMFTRFDAGPAALMALGVNTRGSGLIIGETDRRQAAAIDLMRSEPTRAVVLGSLNLARTITFRTLGLGAQVVVSTSRPPPWVALARGSGIADQQMTVAGEGRFDLPEASETTPVLVVHDTSSAPQEARIAPAPWRTTLHLLNGVHPLTQHILAGADVVVVQQLDVRQAAIVGRLLQLPGRVVNQLTALGPFQVMVLSRARTQLVNLVSTPTESQLFRALG